VLPADLKLYAGGEDNFCHRLRGTTPGQLSEGGTLDRREIDAQKITTVLCETPTVIAGHAFTTGKIKRNSLERVLPNGYVDYTKESASCEYSHYTPTELQGKMVPDEHVHEHATCFNVRGKGLVVISSCGHVGIVNSVRQAQEVSGIQKVHAIVGGFHLGPAPNDSLKQVIAKIKKLEPDGPMHCSGLNFTLEARAQMPDSVNHREGAQETCPLWVKRRPCSPQNGMSALLPKADMCGASKDVCYGPIADFRQR
jgi:7,8-dihydropterin-6-yl-methyl-4-(beta-D-ribofuranosyl)aminobenzene 5'-phosphate synthase